MTFEEHDRLHDAMAGLLIHVRCPDGGLGHYQQVMSFHFNRSMPEHYNTSLGQYVSNEREAQSALSRASDEMSERMGFTHQYEFVDPTDPAAVGVTEEGLEATERVHHDSKVK